MQTKTAQSKSNTYWYNPEGLKRTYGFVLKSKDMVSNQQKQVHFETEVLYMAQRNNSFVFEVRKKQVFVDEKSPSLLFDVLADHCGQVLYPVHLLVSPFGKFLRITNHKEIKERWGKKREILEKQYQGKEVDTLFEQMDKVINDEQKINATLKEDWFFTLFFNPIHGGYGNPASKAEISLVFFPYSPPVVFDTKQSLTTNPNRADSIIYQQQGHCIDPRSLEEMQKGKRIFDEQKRNTKNTEGTVNITYEIYKDSPVFDSIRGNAILEFPNGEAKEIHVEIYNLKNKIPKTSLEKEILDQDIKATQPKPKKHYSLFRLRKNR
ncbi:hypothetical protein ACSTS3_21570 [Aquimarina muelleri]|uniref:hypothetical protein n=1 Tax=Aquimarina muelleri TaxID=279356 RepID=UPI003F685D3D